MTTPTTAAGRRLLDSIAPAMDIMEVLRWNARDDAKASIAAIEAEARVRALDEVRAAVEAEPHDFLCDLAMGDGECDCWHAAILEALR